MSTTYGLHRAVLLNRNGVAIRFENRRKTFAELADRVARLAGALQALGVGRGDRVAVLSLNQDRYLEFYLGVAWAGAVIVPLNIRWSALENEDALRDSRPKLLIVDAAFAAIGSALAQKLGSFRLIYADEGPARSPADAVDYEAILAASAPVPDAEAAETSSPASSTPGDDRTLKRRDAEPSQSYGQCAKYGGRSRPESRPAAIFTPRRCSISRMRVVSYLQFLTGGAHAVIPVFTPEGVAQAIQKYRVTEVLLVPTMIQMIVDFPDLQSFDLSSLRRIVYGASPISEALLDRAMARLPK